MERDVDGEAFQNMTPAEHKVAGHWLVTRGEGRDNYRLYWEDPKTRRVIHADRHSHRRWREAKYRAIKFYDLLARRAAW